MLNTLLYEDVLCVNNYKYMSCYLGTSHSQNNDVGSSYPNEDEDQDHIASIGNHFRLGKSFYLFYTYIN